MGGSLSSPCEDVFVQVVRDQGFQVEAWPRLGRLRGAWVALGRAHTRGAAPKARQRQQSARETASGAGGRSGLRTLRSWPHGPQRQAEARHSRKTQVQALHVELERFHEIPLLLHVLTLPVGWCCFAALRLDSWMAMRCKSWPEAKRGSQQPEEAINKHATSTVPG